MKHPIFTRRRLLLVFGIACLIGIRLCLLLLCGLLCVIVFSITGSGEQQANSILYHTNEDLKKITGVDFPEVVTVDSLLYDDGMVGYFYEVKMVPLQKADTSFFQVLEKACQADSMCWQKDEKCYQYEILPETDFNAFDRTKGMGWRKENVDGELIYDWDGNYIHVIVPFSSDTIIVRYGWHR